MDSQNAQKPENQTILPKKTNLLPLLIILIIISIGSIGFGIYGILKPAEIKEVQKCEEQTSCETESTINFDSDYIYIPEWGIKIKKPDIDVTFYSIKRDNEYDTGTFSIVGIPKDSQISLSSTLQTELKFPSYTASQGMGGVVYRYPAGTYECQYSCQKFMATINDYDYYYFPQIGEELPFDRFSDADREAEGKIVEIIKNTLSDPNSYSAF